MTPTSLVRAVALVVCAAALLTSAACSGSDEASTDGGGGGAAVATDATSSTRVADPQAFCTAYSKINDLAESLPNETLEQRQDGADQLIAAIRTGEEVAPDEIAGDVSTLRSYFEEVKRLADDSTSLDDLESRVNDLGDTDIDAKSDEASTNIENWTKQNCE